MSKIKYAEEMHDVLTLDFLKELFQGWKCKVKDVLPKYKNNWDIPVDYYGPKQVVFKRNGVRAVCYRIYNGRQAAMCITVYALTKFGGETKHWSCWYDLRSAIQQTQEEHSKRILEQFAKDLERINKIEPETQVDKNVFGMSL